MKKVLFLSVLAVVTLGRFLVDVILKSILGYFVVNLLLGGILGPQFLEEEE
jgi:hypothetical protein